MVLEQYKRAFLWRHCSSVVGAVFLLLTSVVFVSGRVKAAREGQIPSPPVPHANLTAALRTSTCSCSCTAEGSLLCSTTSSTSGTKTLAEGGENLPRFNKTGCIDTWLRSPWELGPTPVADHCYCSEVGNSTHYTCQVHFVYSKEKVDVVLTTAYTHLGMMLVAIIWDLFYVHVRYWRVLPRAKPEEIDSLWSAWWLHSYWDVVHGATLWLIWGQAAPLTFAPMGMISSYPPLRYFGPNPYWHERRATGLDELFLWCAIVVFCLTSLLATVRPVSPAITDDELVASSMSVDAMRRRSLSQAAGATSSTQSICATLVCSAILSIGFVIGQPASSVYSLIATVPLWVVVMFHQQSSTWPLERPMPSWKEPWSMRPVDAAMQQNALQTCSDVKNILVPKERVPKVSSLCNTAAFLHAKYPWRTRSQLEDQLQELLLDELRTAAESKDVSAMRHLMCAARVLGYQPPRDNEEEDAEDSLPPKRHKTCCSRLAAYQQLDDIEQTDNMRNSDDNWNAEITRLLRTALRSAVQTAQVLDDDEASLRWLGVMLATIYPEAVSVLPGLLARASVCLEIAMDHPESEDAKDVDMHELSRLVAAAVKLVPDTEGPNRTSAFTWAMNLQGRQQHRAMELMLSRIPKDALRRPHPDISALEVVGGSRSSAIITGLKVCTLQPDTVIGVPELTMPPGCWFYELRLYGFQQQVRKLHGEQAEGVWIPVCRFGWFHEGHRIGGSVFESGGALCSAASCDLPSLCGSSGICSTGVIGCALEVREGTYKACYALNGAWHEGRGGRSQHGTLESSWLANASDGPVFPAVSGQVAFEMIFDADLFVYGPPTLNGKYRPLTEIDRPTVIGRSVA